MGRRQQSGNSAPAATWLRVASLGIQCTIGSLRISHAAAAARAACSDDTELNRTRAWRSAIQFGHVPLIGLVNRSLWIELSGRLRSVSGDERPLLAIGRRRLVANRDDRCRQVRLRSRHDWWRQLWPRPLQMACVLCPAVLSARGITVAAARRAAHQ